MVAKSQQGDQLRPSVDREVLTAEALHTEASRSTGAVDSLLWSIGNVSWLQTTVVAPHHEAALVANLLAETYFADLKVRDRPWDVPELQSSYNHLLPLQLLDH